MTTPAEPEGEPKARSMGCLLRTLVTLMVLIGAVVAAKIGYDWYHRDYTITREDDGQVITKVVQATFARASALKVGSVSGTVQSSATDVRGGGWLRSDKVVKAPFTVDYFIDLSTMGPDKYRWDADNRRLTIDVPDITVARANVDESAVTLDETRGLFVTRDAAATLARKVSAFAQRAAQQEAQKPERIKAARDNARQAVKDLIGSAVAAAKMENVEVVIAFPSERRGDGERWDQSRSLQEVLGNGQ